MSVLDGYFYIVSKENGYYLKGDGENMLFTSCSDDKPDANFKWMFLNGPVKDSKQWGVLMNKHSGLVFCIGAQPSVSDAQIVLRNLFPEPKRSQEWFVLSEGKQASNFTISSPVGGYFVTKQGDNRVIQRGQDRKLISQHYDFIKCH